MLGNGPVRFGGRPHGKGPAQRAPRRAAHPVLIVFNDDDTTFEMMPP